MHTIITQTMPHLSWSKMGRVRKITVEPLIMDTLKSEEPPYNGQTVHPLPIYCTVHTFLPPKKGQNTRPKLVRYSEVPDYVILHVPGRCILEKGNERDEKIFHFFVLFVSSVAIGTVTR